MINNRQQQAGRRRGRGSNGGNGSGGNGGAPRQGGQGRSDNGNRIDNRSRGNANQLYEKYKNLASDAQRQGDRVNTEYYLQFADHYFRVLSDQRGRFDEQQPRRQQPDFDIDGNDDDYGDEGEPIRAGEQLGGQQAGAQDARADRQDRPYREPQDRDAQDRQAQDRQPQDRQAQRRVDRPAPDRPASDRQASDRQAGDRGDQRQEQADRPDRPDRQADVRRADGDQPERPRRWERDERPRQQEAAIEVGGQHGGDPLTAGEDLAARAEAVIAADAPLQVEPAPRRRGRPRRDAAVEQPASEASSAPAGPDGVDPDRLPPSLAGTLSASGSASASDADADAPKPRRRRIRAVETDDASAG